MNLISTAVVGKTYGVDGFLFIYSLSGETKHLLKLTSCLLTLPDGKDLDVKVEKVLTHGNNLLMRFFGYETPEKAKLLSKAVIKVDRSLACKLKKGEVYVADLVSMELVHENQALGKVQSTSEGAQSLLLHVLTYSDNKVRLVPYMSPFTGKAELETNSIPLLNKELLEV